MSTPTTTDERPDPPTVELQIDALAGPSHLFGGLGHGNLASQRHAGRPSSPRRAAHQGLAKMRLVAELGIPQAILAPQRRPDLELLHACGFDGPPARQLEAAARQAPELLRAAWSTSAMWTANAATVTPSSDATDGRLHLTPANLTSQVHRSRETPATTVALRSLLRGAAVVHDPLPAALTDEGAANHMRLVPAGSPTGVGIFVSGEDGARFRARQSPLASAAVARRHRDRQPVFWRQHPAAIDAGAFHNDVVAMSIGDTVVHHALAFTEPDPAAALRAVGHGIRSVIVDPRELSLDEAVDSYLFNSQLLATPGARVAVVEARSAEGRPAAVLGRLRDRGVLDEIVVVDLDQSMGNGGGPACLRLRVPLTVTEFAAVDPSRLVDADLCDELDAWIDRHYRDELTPDDLRDPQLVVEVGSALDELDEIFSRRRRAPAPA